MLDREGIVHFKAHEFFVKGGKHNNPRSRAHGLNTDPPEELWPNIIKTAVVLDELRRRLGRPVRITNAYRSPAYNRAVGGVKYSQHMRFTACDIQSTARPKIVWRTLLQMRREGWFKGGLGRYKDFVHLDTRGKHADWGIT